MLHTRCKFTLDQFIPEKCSAKSMLNIRPMQSPVLSTAHLLRITKPVNITTKSPDCERGFRHQNFALNPMICLHVEMITGITSRFQAMVWPDVVL